MLDSEAMAGYLVTAVRMTSFKNFLLGEEDGVQALEHLLLIGTVVIPLMSVIPLLEQILVEYLETETASITSPFF